MPALATRGDAVPGSTRWRHSRHAAKPCGSRRSREARRKRGFPEGEARYDELEHGQPRRSQASSVGRAFLHIGATKWTRTVSSPTGEEAAREPLLLSGLLFLVIICISIIMIRRDHAHHVNTLWYLFFLISCCYSGLLVYLHDSNLILFGNPYSQYTLWEKAVAWIIKVSTDVKGELFFVFAILLLVIVPQCLCFLISGIFGCGSPPILISTTTRVTILSLIKFFCVLSAIFAGQSIYIFYTGDYIYTPPGERVLLHEHLGGPNMVIRANYNALLMMSVSFAISAIYYKIDALWRHAIDSSRLKSLSLVLKYMTRYQKA